MENLPLDDLTVDRHEKFTDPEIRRVMNEYVAVTEKLPSELFLRAGALYHDLCSVLERPAPHLQCHADCGCPRD